MMVLQDHFAPPLGVRRHWHAFHNAWSTYLAAQLNQELPQGYFAETNVQFGIEIDVATFEEVDLQKRPQGGGWTAPAPTLTVPVNLTSDIVEVLVYGREGGPMLVGAIELVSPANKDRPEHRDAFVSKCAAYLQQGIGLVMVDIVTTRPADLHEALLARLGSAMEADSAGDLQAVAYRPIARAEQQSVDIWYHLLAIGQPLVTLPLYLRGDLCVPVDLNATYQRTCQEQRIPADAS